MLCGVFVIVKFHIEKRKDGLFLPMIKSLSIRVGMESHPDIELITLNPSILVLSAMA